MTHILYIVSSSAYATSSQSRRCVMSQPAIVEFHGVSLLCEAASAEKTWPLWLPA